MPEFKTDNVISTGLFFDVLLCTVILLLVTGLGLFFFKRKILTSSRIKKDKRIEIVELTTQYRLGDLAIVKVDSSEFLLISNKNGLHMKKLESDIENNDRQIESAD